MSTSPTQEVMPQNTGTAATLPSVEDHKEAEARRIADENQTRMLRCHLGLSDEAEMKAMHVRRLSTEPLFFIERSPKSSTAKCKLLSCQEKIWPGEYRVHVKPSMKPIVAADFYHVVCFERIADLSDSDLLDRVQPVTRNTYVLRGLEKKNLLNGNYLLDGGAERLVMEWKFQRKRWIDRRDGFAETQKSDPVLDNLLQRAGASDYVHQMVPGMTQYEDFVFRYMLAPWERAGSGDSGGSGDWNLFMSYLSREDKVESLKERHDLSSRLQCWKNDRILVNRIENLSEEEKEAKGRLSVPAINGIVRLCVLPMPEIEQYQDPLFATT
ncbi:hypothetical protein MMC13_004293 [Lambiella insularis]|nr:hypothetical protein [Lambiella insularis]